MDAWTRQTLASVLVARARGVPLTREHQLALFEQFGELVVRSSDVPDLVRNGRHVWSFGYGGDTLGDDEFTTIETADLWAWGEPGSPMGDPDTVASWAPFRVNLEED